MNFYWIFWKIVTTETPLLSRSSKNLYFFSLPFCTGAKVYGACSAHGGHGGRENSCCHQERSGLSLVCVHYGVHTMFNGRCHHLYCNVLWSNLVRIQDSSTATGSARWRSCENASCSGSPRLTHTRILSCPFFLLQYFRIQIASKQCAWNIGRKKFTLLIYQIMRCTQTHYLMHTYTCQCRVQHPYY
jgi:hypothetical protein